MKDWADVNMKKYLDKEEGVKQRGPGLHIVVSALVPVLVIYLIKRRKQDRAI